MSSGEIPTLPVLVPATAVAIAAGWWWLHRQGRLTPLRAAVGVAASGYVAGVLGHVLLPFPIDTDDPLPWRVWLHLTPFVDAVADPIGIVLNVALFVPFGLLLPLVAGVRSARAVAVCGLVVSLGIELVQLAGDLTISPGRVADVDDLIGNTLGAVLGYAVFSLLVMVPWVAGLALRATWPATAQRASGERKRVSSKWEAGRR
ncbi:VanZ family protein [Nocardioides mangrovi]|uniref:VanZ family protein n=1 Tax=Nocardioides mangrovi TaxID=2874580 RepID=A0ABS7U846_9ACTN|nr:VanZ family protein [Nocardioides mangrovi]MBZ5736888.1 VanZ family protein [Nocardioides mangrovi]